MKALLPLIFWASCLPATWAQSAPVENRKPAAPQGFGSLAAAFTAESLTATQLRDFELRAMQKLQDFAGYLDIIADRGYDEAMRTHARRLAAGLFVSPQNRIAWLIPGITSGKAPDLDAFLSQWAQHGYGRLHCEIRNVQRLQPLNEKLQGALRYDLVVEGYKQDKLAFSHTLKAQTTGIRLLKTEKRFGQELQTVWEPRLDP